MFEKEAEEYANKTEARDWEGFDITREIRKQAFLAGLKAGRPQWHYVKDGEYPTDVKEREYLVALKSEYTNDFFYETDIWCRSLHCFASNNPTKVYAWKEIVPPKEIE